MTNAYTRACLVTIDFLDQYAKFMWFLKAIDTKNTLEAMLLDGGLDHLNEQNRTIIGNLDTIERVDPLNQDEIHKNGTHVNYKLYTHFQLPETADSQQAEAQYIDDVLNSFGTELHTTMKGSLYQQCLEDTIKYYSAKLAKATFRPDKGINFEQYIQSCKVVVTKMNALTDHVPTTHMQNLRNIIERYEVHERKYPPNLENGKEAEPTETTDTTDDTVES